MAARNPSTPLSGKASAIAIPGIENRRDGWRPAPSDISATPGGTMFAMTPGGTKMTWSRQQLMHYAASPLSHSPLHLPRIPGVTIEEDEQDDEDAPVKKPDATKPSKPDTKKPAKDNRIALDSHGSRPFDQSHEILDLDDEHLFDMDD